VELKDLWIVTFLDSFLMIQTEPCRKLFLKSSPIKEKLGNTPLALERCVKV
jgi:hypothetical protein